MSPYGLDLVSSRDLAVTIDLLKFLHSWLDSLSRSDMHASSNRFGFEDQLNTRAPLSKVTPVIVHCVRVPKPLFLSTARAYT